MIPDSNGPALTWGETLTEEEITELLKQSIYEAIHKMTPEKARALLAQLPMYDENGKLKDDY